MLGIEAKHITQILLGFLVALVEGQGAALFILGLKRKRVESNSSIAGGDCRLIISGI